MESHNFILHVANGSGEIDPIDIRIFIDDQLIVNQMFECDDGHNWIPFWLDLSKGKHKIKAVTKKGEASLEIEFELTEKIWAVVTYWYKSDDSGASGPFPRMFTIETYENEIYLE
jgi:hypothetical protein